MVQLVFGGEMSYVRCLPPCWRNRMSGSGNEWFCVQVTAIVMRGSR